MKLKSERVPIGQEIFDQLIDNFPDIIHSVDEDGHIVMTNKFASELLGYDHDELIGMHIFDLYPQHRHRELSKGFADLKEKGSLNYVESSLSAKDGEEIPVEIRSLSLYDQGDNFKRTFSIIRDIRERKTLESQLRQAGKMAAIGELSACVAHDIRNPLSVIKMYNDELRQEIADGDVEINDLPKTVEAISRAVEKIEKLSQHLRNFSRQDEAFAHCSLKSILGNAVFMLQDRLMKSGVKIIEDFDNDATLNVQANENNIEQVFINIIGNACDALIEAPAKNGKNEVSVRFSLEDSLYRVEIHNNGPSINKKIRDQIFNSFFTTKPKGVGTGLGLSICASIIKEHGGTIDVQSENDQGVTFIFTIQAARS